MGKLKVDQYVVGQVQTNCYFAVNAETKEMVVIDPGASAKQLAMKAKENGYTPVAVLLTHGHFDHAGGAEEFADMFQIPIYAHEMERETLETPALSQCSWLGEEKAYRADIWLKDEQEIDLAGFHIRVLLTPGHTVGGCCYYFPYEDAVFTGDSLFCMSVGRTDFPKGSMSQLVRAIKEKLMILPDQTTVFPGHNDITSIEQERMYNPYL